MCVDDLLEVTALAQRAKRSRTIRFGYRTPSWVRWSQSTTDWNGQRLGQTHVCLGRIQAEIYGDERTQLTFTALLSGSQGWKAARFRFSALMHFKLGGAYARSYFNPCDDRRQPLRHS